MVEQLAKFKSSLEDFAQKYKKEINKNPGLHDHEPLALYVMFTTSVLFHRVP
jgi:hypothetical protein